MGEKQHEIRPSRLLCACLAAQSHPTLCNPMDCSPPGSSVHGDSPGKNTEVGCHALLQEIFPTQGWNPGLSHCRQILYHLSHEEAQYWRIKPVSLRFPALAGRFFTTSTTWDIWARTAPPKYIFPSDCYWLMSSGCMWSHWSITARN